MSEATTEREPFEVTEASLAKILDVSETDTATVDEDSSAETSAETTDTETASEIDNAEAAEPEAVQEEVQETQEQTQEESQEEEPEELTLKDGDKVYSFKDAPKAMREVFEKNTQLVKSFVRDNTEDFTNALQELSPSSFEKFATGIVQQSAESAPKAWADFLAKSKPDIALSAILETVKTDTDDFSGASPALLAELYRLMTEESEAGEALRYELETRDENLKVNQKPKLSPEEQAELDDYRRKQKEESEQQEVKERQDVYNKVMSHIETEVVAPIVERMGLMPKESDSKEEQKAKLILLNSLSRTFDGELLQSAVKDDYVKMLEKMDSKDLKGAMVLAPSVMTEVERITLSYLGFITNKRTASISQETKPAKKAPPTLTPSNPVPPAPPKPMTLAERLETATDDEIMRNMGLR